MGRPRKVIAPTSEKKTYALTVLIEGNINTFETDDIPSALLSLSTQAKGKCIVSIGKGGKKIERPLSTNLARRVFKNRLAAEYFTKNALLALSGA